MQLCLRLKTDHECTAIDNTIYIQKNSIPVYSWVNRFRKSKDKVKNNAGQLRVSASIPQKGWKNAVRNAARDFMDLEPCRIPDEIMQKIKMFSPDVIYTNGSSTRVHTAVNKIARKLGIPVILHLMDDWPETIYTTSFLSAIPRMRLLSQLKKTNALCHTNFAISKPLCDKYAQKYQKPYIELMNPVINMRNAVNFVEHEGIRFLYAGSLSLGREKSLIKIAELLYNKLGSSIHTEFTLYVPDQYNTKEMKERFGRFGAIVCNYIPNAELQKRYDDADVLVHIESFEEKYRDFTKYSLSTKIPEYMGAGKPILAFLPCELYGYQYIKENAAGLVAHDEPSLNEALDKMLTDSDLRQQMAENGIHCAKRNHSLESVKQKLSTAVTESKRQRSL